MTKHTIMKCKRWRWQRLSCLTAALSLAQRRWNVVGAPAAILFFALSAYAQSSVVLPPLGGKGGANQFVLRCPEGQHLNGFELRVGDDVDAIQPICVGVYGPAELAGTPEPYYPKWGGNRQLVCPADAPIVVAMKVGWEGVAAKIVNNIHLFCGVAATTQKLSKFPSAVFDGPAVKPDGGLFPSFASAPEEGKQYCPAGMVAIGINGRTGYWLDSVGLICGAPKLTPKPKALGRVKTTPTPPPKALGRVKVPPAGTVPSRSICDLAREARARNSPAAPGLEAQCRAAGEAPAVEVDSLAARGETIANADPLAVELRNQQPDDPSRRGFDIGMAAAEGNTAPGPGKDRIGNSLRPDERGGFNAAVSFSLERNKNSDLAAKGAAIAAADQTVAEARIVEADVFYRLGFDIATGIFGDPALGALGNTATGPGSLKIRDSLSAAGQRGFNAAVKLHLSRNYKP